MRDWCDKCLIASMKICIIPEKLWRKENTSALLVGMQAGTALFDVSVVISQKIRKESSPRPSNTSFGYISKGCSTVPQGHVFSSVIEALFCIARTWKQPKCPLTEE